jgi:hypothetical protein
MLYTKCIKMIYLAADGDLNERTNIDLQETQRAMKESVRY